MAAAGLLITLDQGATAASPARVASVVQAAAPTAVTTTAASGGATLIVDPAAGLTPKGEQIKVSGTGFKTTAGLYVAICHADGKAPASLRDCVGGPIPTANTTKSWAHISSSGVAVPGQIATDWGPKGSFSVSLTMPASNPESDALDCAQVVCAVYTTPDSGEDATQNLAVPLTFGAGPTTTVTTTTSTSSSSSSSTSSSATTSQQVTTSTVSTPPSTVAPKSIRSSSVVAGGVQQVLFAGFAKNEFVSLQLYSAPVSLPAAQADADGFVNISFTVPANLVPGTHLLRAVGQTSRVTGIATFQVTAPVVVSTTASTTVPSSTVASSTPVSSAPASSAVVVPPVSLSPVTSAASTSAAPVVTPPTGKSRLVWPWYVLGAVVLVWIGFRDLHGAAPAYPARGRDAREGTDPGRWRGR